MPGGLERVREPGAEVVAFGIDEDLCLVAQAAEGLRVDDAVPVTLKGRTKRTRLLREHAASRLVGADGEGREPALLVLPGGRLEGICDRSCDLRHARPD